jgi:SAM-dependent methyltransferase
MPKTEPFEAYAAEYEAWFDRHRWVYLSELEAVRRLLPGSRKGFEIGVGSGRFAAPLRIPIGVDPSERMRELARARGVEVLDAVAEKLPFADSCFDYALMVTTICYLDDADAALREVFRVLKPAGAFVAGFVDGNSHLARQYQAKKKKSKFYRSATFYSVEEVVKMARRAGFDRFGFVQTLFEDLSSMAAPDSVEPGHGRGSFVALKAEKVL